MEITVTCAIILDPDQRAVLMARRPKHVHLAGLWEFPGGKIHAGETLESCLARELEEELGVKTRVGGNFFRTTHAYPEKIIHLHFFLCDILSGIPKPLEADELAWIPIADLEKYPLPPADQDVISKLKREFSRQAAQ